jgi:mono/diheme cytochrome c family protein
MLMLVLLACANSPTEPPMSHADRRAAFHAELQAAAGADWEREDVRVTAADPEVGAQVYRKSCAPCHGENGDGRGTRAPALNPPPTNLRTTPLPEAGRLAVIRGGSPGTAMIGYATRLPDDQLVAVARHLRTLAD